MPMNLFTRQSKRGRYDFTVEDSLPVIQNNVSIASSEFIDWTTNGFKSAGQSVNELTAMQVTSVYSCISLIGGAIASLPLAVYQRNGDDRERVKNDIWWLLNEQPHENYSSAVFWETMLASLLLHGDAFARIIRGGFVASKIIGFEWLNPLLVTVLKGDRQELLYRIDNNVKPGKQEVVAASDIIHVAGPGFNGFRGMSQIKYVLRRAAGISLASDEYSARFFENGARPDFAIEIAGNPNVEQQEMMRKSWADRYQGAENSHKPALLAGGAKVHELTMSAEDSQLLQTRQFQVDDIARIFGVPSHMIGSSSSTAWGTGIEQMSIAFVKYTLARHLTKIEKELNRKIWPNREKYFVEFNTAGLERGDYKSRNEGYRIGLGRAGEDAWLTIDEVRKMENLPSIEGGDKLRTATTGQQNEPTPDAATA
jgi:HK97 family phage portal protein